MHFTDVIDLVLFLVWHETKLPQKIKLQILNGRERHEVHLKISNKEARNNSWLMILTRKIIYVRLKIWLKCRNFSSYSFFYPNLNKDERSVNFKLTFWYPRFPQKTNEKSRLHYYDTIGRLVFVRFLGQIEDTKKTCRN